MNTIKGEARLTNDELMEFLTDPVRRKLINWTTLERAAGLRDRRLNKISRNQGTDLNEQEINALVEVLEKLQLTPSAPQNEN